MVEEGSITRYVRLLEAGNVDAARPLVERYFDELVRVAGGKLRGMRSAAVDGEDAALSALNSFCKAVRMGRFPDLEDRHGLWRLLLTMTARKAIDLRKKEERERRGGTERRNEVDFGDDDLRLLDLVGDGKPTPEFAAMLKDEFEVRMAELDDDLREVATARLEGRTHAEIAEQVQSYEATVRRRLDTIYRQWRRSSRE